MSVLVIHSTHELHQLKKSVAPPPGNSGYGYELTIQYISFAISYAFARVLRAGAFCRFGEKFSNFFSECLAHSPRHLLKGYERGKHHPLSQLRKEVIP